MPPTRRQSRLRARLFIITYSGAGRPITVSANLDPTPVADRISALAECLSLYDVRDVEGFAASIAHRYLQHTNGTLSPFELEDLIAYLVAEVWRFSTEFDERPGIEFSGWAGHKLRYSIVQWYRDAFVDSRYNYGNPGQAEAIRFANSLDHPTPDGNPLGSSIPDECSSSAADRNLEDRGLQLERDRQALADQECIRADAARRGGLRGQPKRFTG